MTHVFPEPTVAPVSADGYLVGHIPNAGLSCDPAAAGSFVSFVPICSSLVATGSFVTPAVASGSLVLHAVTSSCATSPNADAIGRLLVLLFISWLLNCLLS